MIFWAIIPAAALSIYLLIEINRQAIEQGSDQLKRENSQLTVELERTLLQIQNKLIRLSEQGAIIKSATVSFMSQKANAQMDTFRNQNPAIDSVVLMDVDQFPMEVSPEAALIVDFSSLEVFINTILYHRYNLALESAAPRFKYFYNQQLAGLNRNREKAEYLVMGQPVIRQTDSLSKPFTTDGLLLVTVNLDALVRQLISSAKIDISNAGLSIEGENFTFYKTPWNASDPFMSSKEQVDFSLLRENPALFISLKRPIISFRQSLIQTVKTFALLVTVFMATVLLGATLVSRKLTKPLRRLQQATSKIARGDYSNVPPISKFGEFRQLTDLLNNMGETIQSQLAQLNITNIELESKITERTHELQESVSQLSYQGRLMRALMQVTVDMQKSKDIDTLLNCSLAELVIQFKKHTCGIVINRVTNLESSERFSDFPEASHNYLSKHLEAWRMQDFDFRIDQFADQNWTLIPIRDTKKNVIGQLILLGPMLTEIERDVLFILTRLSATIVDQISLNFKLERLANTDALTGLANRHFFESQYNINRKKWTKKNHDFGLIIIDVNFLKKINDQYGHENGDLLIQEVASQLQKICRESDVLARMGGDEFYILLPDSGYKACKHAADRLMAANESMYLKISHQNEMIQLPISYSLGLACTEADPIDSLTKLADERMYLIKNKHR